MASAYLTPEYARYCLRSMAEQMHERYPSLSAGEIGSLLLEASSILMSEYSKYLVSAGFLSREEAAQEIRLALTGKQEDGRMEAASM